MTWFAERRQLKELEEATDEVAINNAAVLLSQARGRHVTGGLERLLASHQSTRGRAMAAWALGFQASGGRGVTALVRALSDRDEEVDVRAHAAEALGHLALQLGDHERDALGALLHGLRDSAPEVRFWSAFALGNLGDEAAIPALERLAARDEESVPGWWSIRKEANDSIKQILLVKRNRAAVDGVEEA